MNEDMSTVELGVMLFVVYFVIGIVLALPAALLALIAWAIWRVL